MKTMKNATNQARVEPGHRNDVVLLRHGETPWSKIGRFAGLTDLELTPQGEAMASAARNKIDQLHFDRIVASPLVRARRTAELLALGEVVVDARLVERDYGDYEGMTTEQIRAQAPGWNVWSDPVPNGETIEAMTWRVDSFVRDLQHSNAGTTLVVAHAHLIRLFAARWLGLEPRHAQLFRLGTLGMVHLGWEREHPVMHKWNA